MPRQHEAQLCHWVLSFYDDLSTWFPDRGVDIRRDRKHAVAALDRGDLSLWTKELPKAHSALLASLESGKDQPTLPHCGWLSDLVGLAPDPVGICALKAHRQMSHLLYKLELPYDEKTKSSTLEAFKSTEVSLVEQIEHFKSPGVGLESLLGRARVHLASALGSSGAIMPPGYPSRTKWLRDIKGLSPRHGPGAVATGERGSHKWRFSRKYETLHARFPYYDWFVARGTPCLLDQVSWYTSLERVPSPTAKIVLVPKDSRGPRIISEEPLELQYMQQAYFQWMISWARNHSSPFHGHVLFEDQVPSRQLALSSSLTREYATLDLKDASDRVSVDLVQAIWPEPIFTDLMALRSTHTLLPSGERLALRKMSPMGSAVCFPTMAYTIYALCVAALEYLEEYGESGSLDARYAVYIYGDDIIVPAQAYTWVEHALKLAGLKVNKSKSFVESHFRESCGCDAFWGVDITPTRVRRLLGHCSSFDESAMSYCAYVNSLRERGWSHSAASIEKFLKARCRILPTTWDPEKFPGIRVDRGEPLNMQLRWNPDLSRLEAKTFVPYQGKRRVQLAGWSRLLRNLTQGAGESPDDEALRGSVVMKRRWVGT